MKMTSPTRARKRRGTHQVNSGDTITLGDEVSPYKDGTVRLESLRCCDCGLTHILVLNRPVKVRIIVDTTATRQCRRTKKYRKRIAEVVAKVRSYK